MKVLLVEDNPGDARLIREMLAEVTVAPVDLECADRLSTGLERLAKGEIDVVLLDLSLPDSHGLGTLVLAQEEAPEVPIVVLTGLEDEGLAVQAVQKGAEDYLVKGRVDGNTLVRAMRYATERKRAKVELQASKESFRNIVEKNGYGILVADRKGAVRFTNPSMESFFGRRSEEFLGKAFNYPLVAGETIEIDLVHHGDKPGIGEMQVIETEWEGDGAFLVTLRDITDRKKADEALRESEKKAVEALEELKIAQHSLVQAEKLSSVGQLVSGVAHELNNPLAGIRSLSRLVMRRDLDETLKKELAMIHEEAERSVRIVQNLLSFARRHEGAKVYTSINTAIEATLELRRYELRVNNVELEVHLEPTLPPTMADVHEIQQVALNLIVNAEQAMLEAHGEGRLLVKTEQVGSMIRFVVSDNGPGISKENLGKLFDPFFTTKDVGKGTGLGLSICYGIVQEHGGRIWAESEPPNGATFFVELPIVCYATEMEPQGETRSHEQEKSAVSCRPCKSKTERIRRP